MLALATRNRKREPYYYWTRTASTKPEAQVLAKRIGLSLPDGSPDGPETNLMYPIRRLVATGLDSPENLTLLLGPYWQCKAGNIFKQARMEVLVVPMPDSPYAKFTGYLDGGCPWWAPRAPSKEEEARLERYKKINELLDY